MLKVIKNIQIPVIDYCYEPSEGVLAILSNNKVHLFYLHQPKYSKLYQGPSFNIRLDPSVNKSINSGPKGYNLLKHLPKLDCNQLQLFKIYEYLYLIHLDNLEGFLYFYQIIPGKNPEIFANYKISQGVYSIGLSENLIIVHSYNTQETLIYDIQSHLQEYLIKVNHTELIYPTNNRLSAEYSIKINLTSEFYFIEDDITIDLKSSSFKTYIINPITLIENHPDNIKIITFLLRRDNCKMNVLEKLKEMLLSMTSLIKLKNIFLTLATVYSIAKEDKNNNLRQRKFSENAEHLEMSPTEIDTEFELKIESGVTVLMQSDIYSCVFAPVYKQIDNQIYFADALFCFVNLLIHCKVQVHFSIQYLLFKVLVKIKDFIRIQKLVENKFFTDSQDIALFLTSLGKTENIQFFPNCFILGIDMLHRLKLFDLIMNELSEQEYYYESLYISKMNNISDEGIQEIIKHCGFDYD